MRRDPYQAIADPTRREIISLIASRPMNLNRLSEKFEVSRPAISRHIRILTECGLVVIRQEGRERICVPNLKSLSEVSSWVNQFRLFWTGKLDALGNFLEEEKKSSHKSTKTKKK